MSTSAMQSHNAPSAEPLKVGESLPKAMGPRDMMRAFGWAEATFYRKQREGKLRPFLLPRELGKNRYSGEKVQAHLNGRK